MLAAPTGFGGDDRPITLPERTLGDLLNETFVIYGKNVWVVMGIAALVQAPVAMVALLLGRGSVDPTAAFFVEFILQCFTGFYVYGALAFAAGQQYVTGEMGIGMSYSRVWWRIVSLSALSLIVLAAFTLGALLFFLVVPVVLSLVFMVYWSVSVPAMVVQRMSAMDALRTSFRLVKGSWWRVFGISLVVGLVTVGLMIVAALPFLAGNALAGLAGLDTLGDQMLRLGGIAGGVVAAPVPAIAGTLLYYDLRVRREGFDLSSLSSDMGFSPAEDRMEGVSIHSKGMGRS